MAKRTKQVVSIASVVGDGRVADGKLCVDGNNRTWRITNKHGGCILEGTNTDAVIPYWSCYYIELPGLKIFDGNYTRLGSRIDDSPSLLEDLLRLSVKDGDLLRDQTQGLLWVVRVSEYGLSLEGYDDNHFMPMQSLGVLSFGVLERINTKAQRQLRKLEHDLTLA